MNFSFLKQKIKENALFASSICLYLVVLYGKHIFFAIFNVASLANYYLLIKVLCKNSFSNSIYRKISDGFNENMSQILFTIVSVMLISFFST